MLAQILSALLIILTLGLYVNCVPVKRSLFDLSPIHIRFSSNAQSNPNNMQTNNPVFPVPDIKAPFQFAGNIFDTNNNFMPRSYYDASENSLNGRVHMKYKLNVNSNPVSVQPAKEHTYKSTTTNPETTTFVARNKIHLAGRFNKDSNDVNTQNMDSTNDYDTTESTTEFETTTTDDLLNRMAIPSSVLASLAG